MDWSNEEYVKVYKRETDDDMILSWQALALWRAMLLKFDRSGLLSTKRGARGVAVLVRIPIEVVEPALAELLSDGRVHEVPSGYFAPNFLDAQEASKSDKLRQRESRQRRANDLKIGIETNNDVTNRDQTSHGVTSSHAASQPVTLSYADPDPDPDPEKLSPARARAIPPSTVPGTEHGVHVESETQRRDRRRELTRKLWSELGSERMRVAREIGAESDTRPLPAVGDPGERALAMRISEADAAGQLERVAADARHVISVAVAEARASTPPSVQWLTGALFEDRSWRRALGMTVSDAGRQRGSPASSQFSAPWSSNTGIRKTKPL